MGHHDRQPPHRGQIVGQKHIGSLGDLIEQFLTFLGRDIDTDTALAAIGMFDQRMPIRVNRYTAHVDKTALGVAAHRMARP